VSLATSVEYQQHRQSIALCTSAYSQSPPHLASRGRRV